MFIAGVACFALVACEPNREAGPIVETSVDYRVPVSVAAPAAGLNVEKTQFETLGQSRNGAGVETRFMQVVPVPGRNLERLQEVSGPRGADARELVAFIKAHPDAMPKGQAVCAPGQELEMKGFSDTGFPAMRLDGRVGIWKNGCTWALMVHTPSA